MKTKGFTRSSAKKIIINSEGEGLAMGDWADLPLDLLTLIAKRINLYEDFVALGGVCRSWRPVAVKENFNPSARIPWLMLQEAKSGKQQEASNDLRGFMSLTKGGMVRKVELPEARGTHCISSKGWLITMDSAYEMELLHPLTRVSIPLPHPQTFKYHPQIFKYYTRKILMHRAALSANPSVTEDYILMVIFGVCYIGFWKPGNNIWSVIETQGFFGIHDVICYKHQFYAINFKGHLVLCNFNSCTSQIAGRIPSSHGHYGKAYLVDCGSELLVVYNKSGYKTLSFRVFKFDPTNTEQYLQEISGGEFGGRSIFVSPTAATVVLASAAAAGIEPNCIYFAECFANRYVTVRPSSDKNPAGIYKWECQTQKRALHRYTPPIWILPSF